MLKERVHRLALGGWLRAEEDLAVQIIHARGRVPP